MISALLSACAYVGLSVGAVLGAEVDDHRQQLDANYRAYAGEDFGDWRVEFSAERLASGISFDNVLAIAYGVASRRDFDAGPYTLSAGVGADMLDVQSVQGVQKPVQGSGFSAHVDFGIERRLRSDVFATANVSFRASNLDFPSGSNVTFDDWRTSSLTFGLRKEF